MNISKLYEGQMFKNYKELCKEIEMEVKKSGDTKKAQFKELTRYCEFEKVGQKIIITKVYDIPLPKIDGRGKSGLKTPLYITNPRLAEQWLVEENGMELPETLVRTSNEEYWWKCAICVHKIRSAPHKRFNKTKGCTDEFITCPYCNLSKGAKIIYDYLEFHDISFKLEHTYDDLLGLGNKKLRFDFALFDNENKLIALIEFDGSYHDEDLNPDKEKHKVLSTHDTLKDRYCAKNNIPLLRIHHTAMDEIKTILFNYLTKLDSSLIDVDANTKDYNKNLFDIIMSYKEKKELLQAELSKINDAINYFQSLV